MRLIDYPILYINLDKDKKRRIVLEKDLDKLDMNYNRIEAIYGKNLHNDKYRLEVSKLLGVHPTKLHPNYWMDRHNFKSMSMNENNILARVGAYLSHLKSIKYAYDNNYDKLMIMEDDACPLVNFYEEFPVPKNTDILYAGGYFIKQDGYNPDYQSSLIPININEFKLVGAYSYILPNRKSIETLYKVLMSVFLQGKGHDKDDNWRSGKVRLRATNIDVMYVNYFQKLGKTYVINPVRVAAREFQSNITNNRSEYKLSSFLNPEQQYELVGVHNSYEGIYKYSDEKHL
ncbi:glycosyltransferase family 25 protein [bacterium]|nr:glycosyltransferase family 25 protein [bacterium]